MEQGGVMSGGSFDYAQYRIRDIWEEIRSRLDRQGKRKDSDDLWSSQDYYEKYPEELTYEVYPPEVAKRLEEAVEILKRAEVYAQRADYFFAGDDGEENFLKRLKQELAELDNES
jgi:hypothetical protein